MRRRVGVRHGGLAALLAALGSLAAAQGASAVTVKTGSGKTLRRTGKLLFHSPSKRKHKHR